MIGNELNKKGIVFNKDNNLVVHLILGENEKIKSHKHEGQHVFFTVVKGEVEVYLDEKEKHKMSPGSVLEFAGEHAISATSLSDSEVFVYLIEI